MLGGTAFVYLKEAIVAKAAGYITNYGGLTETFQILLLLVIALLVTKDRFKAFVALAPLVVAAALLGSMRINMIAVTVMFYLWLTEQKLHHPVVVLLLSYFTLKSIPFIHNVFQYGDGFAGFLF
jgi:hypothetical protein